MSYIVKSNNTDISDYVIDASKIPIWQRNRDWSVVVSEIDLTVSGKASAANVAPGRRITIASSGSSAYPFYIGIISERKYNYADASYTLQIRSILTELDKYTLSYNTLHSSLIAGATFQQYRPIDNDGYPSVQLLWLLQQMFSYAVLPIQLPSSTTFIETIISLGGVPRNIQLQHLRLDENMLYAIGQGVATNHTNIDADPEKLLLVPTFLDFFNWFVNGIGPVATGNIGWNVRWSTSGTPAQLRLFVRDDDEITISDDVTYGREDGNIVGDDEGYSYNWQYASRASYANSANNALTDHKGSSGLGKTSIDVPTNLRFNYEEFWTVAGYASSYNYPITSFLHNKIAEVETDFSTRKLISDTTSFVRAKEQYIDVDRYESEIIQEF